MPFRSQAQRRKFYALKAEGKMDQKTIDEWERDTPEDLPERKTAAYVGGASAALRKLGLDFATADAFAQFAEGDDTDENKDIEVEDLDDDAHARNNDKLINPPSPWTGAASISDSKFPDF